MRKMKVAKKLLVSSVDAVATGHSHADLNGDGMSFMRNTLV